MEAVLDEGITEPVMKFRGEKNVTSYLTPDEMYTLTNDALAHIESIYDHSWERKDAIDAALEAVDREWIEVVEWWSGGVVEWWSGGVVKAFLTAKK